MSMLVMIRSGQSQGEAENRLCGWSNYDLTQKGREQAQEAAESLCGYRWDLVLVRDLQSAQSTARIVLERNPHECVVELHDGLRDRHGGIHEGKTFEKLRAELPPKHYKLWERQFDRAPELGESFKDVGERVLPFAQAELYPRLTENQNVLVIAHDAPIRAIISDLTGTDPEEIPALRVHPCVPVFWYGRP